MPTPRGLLERLARAAEQGFKTDEPVYHWTTAENIQEFTPSASGKYGPGIYTSPKEEYGKRYAPEGRPMSLMYRGSIAGKPEYNDAFEAVRQEMIKEYPKEIPSLEFKQRVNKRLADQGFSGLRIDDELLVFDPKDLRSTEAQFLPENIDSTKLMGGAIPAGLLAPQGAIDELLTPRQPEMRAAINPAMHDAAMAMSAAARNSMLGSGESSANVARSLAYGQKPGLMDVIIGGLEQADPETWASLLGAMAKGR